MAVTGTKLINSDREDSGTMKTDRQGKTGLILVVVLVAAAGGVAYTSPDTAEDFLPAQVLPALPQFEKEQTEINCTTIEEGTEAVNDIVPEGLTGGEDLKPAEIKDRTCGPMCGERNMSGHYCSSDLLTCVCRTE